jgi:lipopolysaccharide O-acetyltransferase
MKVINYVNHYGLIGFLRLFYEFLLTKIFFYNAKLIRRPIDIRGKNLIDFGKNLTTGRYCRIEVYSNNSSNNFKIIFGNNVQLNDNVHITAMEKVVIGNNVLMASKIYISDCSHGNYNGDIKDSNPSSKPSERIMITKPVIIEDNVWLGEFVSVLPGVKIGKGSIIGSNSVVTKDIPANTIAVGSPARVIKKFNFKTKRWELEKK